MKVNLENLYNNHLTNLRSLELTVEILVDFIENPTNLQGAEVPREFVNKLYQNEFLASVAHGSVVQGCTTKAPLILNLKTIPGCSWWRLKDFAITINMINHWNCQPRHQSTNQILLLWLIWRICNHFIKPCRSGRSLCFAQITVPCHRLCMELPSIVLPFSINMQWLASTTYVPSMYRPTHIMALNSCHLFQRNLTFPRCGEESTTCSITSIIGPKKDHPVTMVFVGIFEKELMNLLVETCRNNKTIMF